MADPNSETRLSRPESGDSTDSSFFGRLGSLGNLPNDQGYTRLQHRFLVYMPVLMGGGGLVWGTLALVFLTPMR